MAQMKDLKWCHFYHIIKLKQNNNSTTIKHKIIETNSKYVEG